MTAASKMDGPLIYKKTIGGKIRLRESKFVREGKTWTRN